MHGMGITALYDINTRICLRSSISAQPLFQAWLCITRSVLLYNSTTTPRLQLRLRQPLTVTSTFTEAWLLDGLTSSARLLTAVLVYTPALRATAVYDTV